MRSLVIALYTLCICIISVFLTLFIQYRKEISATHAIAPAKTVSRAQGFDTFVAYGGYGVDGPSMIRCDTILNSNLIKEEDKKILSEFDAKCKYTESTSYFRLYNIY